MLPRQLITAILLLCVLAFAFFAYSIGSYMLLAIGVLLPPLLMFSARVDLIAFWVVALYLSTLTLPGMPIDLQMYQLMMVFFVIAAMAQRIVVKWPYPTPPGRGWVLLLIVFLAVLIRIRGLGLRVMGGSLVGGAAYVHLFLAMASMRTLQSTTVMRASGNVRAHAGRNRPCPSPAKRIRRGGWI